MNSISRARAEKLLVISDNSVLSDWLQRELNRHHSDELTEVAWRYSESNREPDEMIALGATPVDVKDAVAVREIVTHFDLVLSVHCKQIFPAELVEGVLCVNVHPGLNPYNRGWFPQAFSIINGLPVGATIHIMDSQVDHGPIIDQETILIDPGDTSLEVYQKIIELEKSLLSKNLAQLLSLSFGHYPPDGAGNYNSLANYRSMCELDLSDLATMRDHLALLRALSHGDFRNAYFIDGGRKYYVKILIEPETD